MMKAVEEIKKSFMSVLYKEMKYINKSKYLMQNTSKYISWVLQDKPIIKKNVKVTVDDKWLSYQCSFSISLFCKVGLG